MCGLLLAIVVAAGSTNAQKVHASTLIIDTHADTPQRFVDEHFELDRAQKQWAPKIPRPPLKSLIDHIAHIAKTAGVDHVGLGSDFDGVSSLPQGIDSAADLPKITEALAARGYGEKELRKILGGNLLRVFRDCERVSREAGSAK